MTIAELNQIKKDRKEQMEEIILKKKLEKEAQYLNSSLYEQRQLEAEDLETLDAYISQLEQILEVDNRKRSYVFGYGTIPDKVLSLVKSIKYLKAHEKEEMLLSTGLTEIIIDDLVEAFGMTAYFSMKTETLVPEVPMDIDVTKQLLTEVMTKIGLVSNVSLSKFNEDNVNYQYKKASVKAEEAYEMTLKYADKEVNYEE